MKNTLSIPIAVVMMPSTRKIFRQEITDPIELIDNSPDARKPPTIE